jgi:tRNA pseudouridine38-40 synthase
MRYFKLTIAYDGTDFHGWQFQAGHPTIQGEIVSVLRRLTREKIQLNASGRTDAGVHALGQVASFHTKSALSAKEFQRALNALLPPAIRIIASAEVGPAFHARWSATSKYYCYRLYRGKVVPPAVWRYVLHYPFPLDEQAMQDAALRFIGAHDFTSFAASTGSEDDDKERNMVREIYSAEVKRVDGEELHFNVHGQSFLRYMVRKMMGALLEVGRGRMTADDIDRLYELKDRSKSGPTAPPEGLCMVRVEHDEGWRIGNP